MYILFYMYIHKYRQVYVYTFLVELSSKGTVPPHFIDAITMITIIDGMY